MIQSGSPPTVAFVGPSDPAWTEVLSELAHDFYHLPAYAAFSAAREGSEARAFIYRDRSISFLWPLLLTRTHAIDSFHASCPYGYPGPTTNAEASAEGVRRALRAFVETLREQRVVTVFSRLHPLLPQPLDVFREFGTIVTHGQTVSIDLEAPLEVSASQMRPTHRRHIRAAERLGYRATFGWKNLDGYLDCYRQTMLRAGASDYYLFDRLYVEELHAILGDRLHLASVCSGEQVISAGLFAETNGTIQYHLGGTLDAFLSHSPAKLLFDFVRRWGKERHQKVLHLGGGVGGKADDLFAFKSGFSGRRHSFHTFRVVIDEPRYLRLCEEAGVSPDRDSFFPPFRAQ